MKQPRKKIKNIQPKTIKRDDGTTYQAFLVYKTWPDGDEFRKRYRNLTEAKTVLARIDGALASGQWKELRDELTPIKNSPAVQVEPKVITFGQLGNEFKNFVLGKKSGSDWPKIQCYLVDAMTEFFEADTPIPDITIKRCEEFIAYRRTEDEAKACTVNKDLAVLRAMFVKAVKDWHYLPGNPIAGLMNLDDDTLIHDRYLTPEEIKNLLSASISLPQNADAKLIFGDMPEFIVIGVNTGMRLSESLTLPLSHINFGERILSVKNKPTRRTKNGSERHIGFNQDTYDALVELRRKAVNKFGTLFQMEDGSGWLPHKSILQKRFAACAEAAGLYREDRTENVTIHTLRHTFGSQLAIAGKPVVNIKKLMGHNRLETTMRYMHLSEKETHRDTEVLQGMAKLAINRQHENVAVGTYGL